MHRIKEISAIQDLEVYLHNADYSHLEDREAASMFLDQLIEEVQDDSELVESLQMIIEKTSKQPQALFEPLHEEFTSPPRDEAEDIDTTLALLRMCSFYAIITGAVLTIAEKNNSTKVGQESKKLAKEMMAYAKEHNAATSLVDVSLQLTGKNPFWDHILGNKAA